MIGSELLGQPCKSNIPAKQRLSRSSSKLVENLGQPLQIQLFDCLSVDLLYQLRDFLLCSGAGNCLDDYIVGDDCALFLERLNFTNLQFLLLAFRTLYGPENSKTLPLEEQWRGCASLSTSQVATSTKFPW